MKANIKEFAEWAGSLKYEDIPAGVLHKTKLQILNYLAAGIHGFLNQGEKLLKNALSNLEREGNCTLLNGEKRGLSTAIFANSTLSMMYDYDDYLFMGHTGHSSLFSSLALCEHLNLSGKDLLKAMVIANEFEGRLGASVLVGPHNGQLWGFIHQAGTAVLTALLFGGSSQEIYNALLISLYNPPYALEPGFMGGASKYLTASLASESGLKAGLLALAGAKGEESVLDGEKGFLAKFSYLPMPEVLSAWGEIWVSETLSYKPYPGCAYVQPVIDCLSEILWEFKRSGSAFKIDEIKEITVNASLLTLGMEKMSEPYRYSSFHPVNVNFSVPLSIAVVLLKGEVDSSAFSHSFITENRQSLLNISKKIKLNHQWKYTINLIKGIKKGIDFYPLFRQRGVFKALKASSKLRKEHRGISSFKEILKLFTNVKHSKHIGTALKEGVNWKKFDFSKSRIRELEFNFGASLEVKTKSGIIYSAEFLSHRGSNAREWAETEEIVKNKFLREYSNYTKDKKRGEKIIKEVMEIEGKNVRDLTSILW